MQTFLAMLKPIDGKKTHLLALAVVVIAVVEGLAGVDVPGVVVGENWLEWIIGGAGAMALRDALRKIGISA